MTNRKPDNSLPDGGYDPTYASNYGLDGFIDSEYGGGPDNERKITFLPRSQKGLSALPDGLISGENHEKFDGIFNTDEDGGLGNISGMVKKVSYLTDLSWLEQAEQDPARLPEHHNDAVIEGLVEAWGTNRRTDGVHLIQNTTPPPAPRSMSTSLPGDQYRTLIASAMRRTAFGDSFENIVDDTVRHLGNKIYDISTDGDMQKFAAAMRSVHAERNIVGKVYLRDSAFPGLLTGKWGDIIRKKCASAAYWLTSPGSKLSAYDNFMGKKVVTSIPWEQALKLYYPRLTATGRKVSSGDPKKVLIEALNSKEVVRKVSTFRSSVAPVNTISSEEAWSIFASAPKPEREVIKVDYLSAVKKKADHQLDRWVASGLLSADDSKRIKESESHPLEKVRAGATIIASSGKKATYDGVGTNVTIPVRPTKDAAWANLRSAELKQEIVSRTASKIRSMVKTGELTDSDAERILASGLQPADMLAIANIRSASHDKDRVSPVVESRSYNGVGVGKSIHTGFARPDKSKEKTASVDSHINERVERGINRLVSGGALSSEDAKTILSSSLTPRQKMEMANYRVAMPGEVEIKPQKVASYSGPVVKEHIPVRHSSSNPKEVQTLLKYASHVMNNGAAGKDLDNAITSKFSSHTIEKAGSQLVQIRRKHEGLAGHLYVDASVYASKDGLTGCEEGSRKHRASAVPSVLSMPRCASCVHNTSGSCQKYNKKLVDSPPISNPEEYQSEVIKMSSEDTGEVFSMYDPSEFQLQNDNLNGFDVSAAPGKKDLDVTFGSMTIEGE